MSKLKSLSRAEKSEANDAIRTELERAGIVACRANVRNDMYGQYFGYYGSVVGIMQFADGEMAVFTRGWSRLRGEHWYVQMSQNLPLEVRNKLEKRAGTEVREPSYVVSCIPTCQGRHYVHRRFEVDSMRGLIAFSKALKEAFGDKSNRLQLGTICKENSGPIVPESIKRLPPRDPTQK